MLLVLLLVLLMLLMLPVLLVLPVRLLTSILLQAATSGAPSRRRATGTTPPTAAC